MQSRSWACSGRLTWTLGRARTCLTSADGWASASRRTIAGGLRDEIRAAGMIDDGRSPPSRLRGQRADSRARFRPTQVIAGQAVQKKRCAMFQGDGPGPALRVSGRRQIHAKPTWSFPVRDHPTRTVFRDGLPSMGDRIGTPFALSVQWSIYRVRVSRCAEVLVFQHHCVIAGSKTRKTGWRSPGFFPWGPLEVRSCGRRFSPK